MFTVQNRTRTGEGHSVADAENGGVSRRTVLGGLVAGVGVVAAAVVAGCDSTASKTASGNDTSGTSGTAPGDVHDGSDANSVKAQTVEKRALEILGTAKVQDALAQGLRSYAASDVAGRPDALRYAKSALDNHATLASLYAAMGAAPDPVFVWVYAASRRWNGYTVPGSRWSGDNVDTFYRGVRLNPTSSYEITIHPSEKLPAQLSFMMYDWLMLESGASGRSDVPLGTFVVTDETPRNPDGSITLTVGPEPTGSANHMQLKPGTKQILAREIKGDWSVPPVRLSIKRTAGEAPPNQSLDQLSQEAAALLSGAVLATQNISAVFGQLSENELSPLHVRWIEESNQKVVTDEPVGPDVALGFLTNGLFNLKEDETFVMTLNMLGAEYLSVNSYRPFLVSPEGVYGSSSLNNFQAKSNPDGSFTFVVARKDPGVHNWIDVSGIPYGEPTVRWQTLTHPVSGTLKTAVQQQAVMNLGDLRKDLPPTTVWVTPEERQQQRESRAKNFRLRCLGTPCEVGGDLDKMY